MWSRQAQDLKCVGLILWIYGNPRLWSTYGCLLELVIDFELKDRRWDSLWRWKAELVWALTLYLYSYWAVLDSLVVDCCSRDKIVKYVFWRFIIHHQNLINLQSYSRAGLYHQFFIMNKNMTPVFYWVPLGWQAVKASMNMKSIHIDLTPSMFCMSLMFSPCWCFKFEIFYSLCAAEYCANALIRLFVSVFWFTAVVGLNKNAVYLIGQGLLKKDVL